MTLRRVSMSLAIEEVCEEVINKSSIPSSAKEQALASCKK
jgi:hypothetical protein